MAAVHFGMRWRDQARPAWGAIDRHCGGAAGAGGRLADHPAMATRPFGPRCPPCRPSWEGGRRDPAVHPSRAHGPSRGRFRGPSPPLLFVAPPACVPSAPPASRPVSRWAMDRVRRLGLCGS
eukprot:1317098-Alexandrium_andersonii.AAC.1